MRTVLTCTLVAAVLQQAPIAPPPRDSRPPNAVTEGTGTIKGRVYDRETGAPVPNTAVTLTLDLAAARDGMPPGPPNAVARPAPPRQPLTFASVAERVII